MSSDSVQPSSPDDRIDLPTEVLSDADTEPAEGYDPTGLEMARAVASSLAGRPSGAGAMSRRSRSGNSGGTKKLRPVVPPQSSGAHPDDRDPQLFGQTLDRLVQARGWSTDVNVHTILGRWTVLVGPVLAQHTAVEAYRDSVVTVRASSTAWATQLRGMASRLVATLNDQLGEGTVTKIVVLGPDVPSWRRRRMISNGRGPRDTYG